MDILTNPDHLKNAEEDHSKMLSKNELMILSRWVDTNYQFVGSFYGRHHSEWQKPKTASPNWNPKDFRRKATFQEAIDMYAPKWHR